MMQHEVSSTILKLTLFGAPRVELDGQSAPVARRKALALLAYLAVTGRAHSRDALATLFWPETSQTRARGNLRRVISDLNREISASWLLADRESVALQGGDELWTDVTQFRTYLAVVDEHDHATAETCPDCLATLATAVELYQADFLAGFTLRNAVDFDDWQYFEGEELRRTLAWALEQLVNGHRTLGVLKTAISYCRRWMTLDPLQESVQQLLMPLYYEAGQSATALRQYDQLVTLLDDELGQPPDEATTALYAAIKANRLPQVAATASTASAALGAPESPEPESELAPRHHLPAQATRFVGRTKEVQALSELLRAPDQRAVTLVGPGGIGKTRLSLAVAEAVKGHFADGVHFVPLAPLQTADNIIAEVVDSLDMHFYGNDEPKTQLFGILASKELLLIMDNFEHLLAGAHVVSDLLRVAPRVKVLASSRERLNLSGETVYVVSGMRYPVLTTGRNVTNEDDDYSAVKLLSQQARLVRPGLEMNDGFLDSAARICRLVQGMPLAIVLAAGWLDMLSPAEIAEEISGSLDFLETAIRDIPDRQRSMRAVFDRSWDRLSADEQTVFMKLAVFRGDFGRDDAGAIADATLRSLRGLVNKSFVIFNQRDRFEVHELLRQYGEEVLRASGEEAATRQRHSEHYLDFVRHCEADLRGPGQVDALQSIRADFENIRAGWDWALAANNLATLGDAIEPLHLYFDMYGVYGQGATFLDATLGKLNLEADGASARVATKITARLRFMQSIIYDLPTDWEDELAVCQRIATDADDEFEVGFCAAVIGACMIMLTQDPLASLTPLEQALQIFERIDDRFYQARVLSWMALAHRLLTNPVENERMFRQQLTLTREIGDAAGITSALYNLAEVAIIAGRYDETRANCKEVFELGRGVVLPFSNCLLGLDHLLRGEMEASWRALGRAEALYDRDQAADLLLLICATASVLAALTEDNDCSEAHGQRALSLPASDPFYVTLANWGLAMTACNQGEFTMAHTVLCAAFDSAHSLDSIAIQTWLLPVAAVISAHENETDAARTLLWLAVSHPLGATGWHACWPLLTLLQAELGSTHDEKGRANLTGDMNAGLESAISAWLAAHTTAPIPNHGPSSGKIS